MKNKVKDNKNLIHKNKINNIINRQKKKINQLKRNY